MLEAYLAENKEEFSDRDLEIATASLAGESRKNVREEEQEDLQTGESGGKAAAMSHTQELAMNRMAAMNQVETSSAGIMARGLQRSLVRPQCPLLRS